MQLSSEQRAAVLGLARSLIRDALEGKRPALPKQIDEFLLQPAGCFVSLHTLAGGRLRGCVGRIDATHALAEALRSSSVHVLQDPRFTHEPVRADELSMLELEVSVLSPARPVESPLEFDPLEHGIYLTFGGRSGCFLPQVARETGWTREQLLDSLCIEKLGLPHTT